MKQIKITLSNSSDPSVMGTQQIVGGLFQGTTFPAVKNTQQPSFEVQPPNTTLPVKSAMCLPRDHI